MHSRFASRSAGLRLNLEALLHRNVDVSTVDMLKDQILEEVVVL